MKQFIKIIRKVDLEHQYIQILRYEMDYELTSLHDALHCKDTSAVDKSKKRLAEISTELKELGGLA